MAKKETAKFKKNIERLEEIVDLLEDDDIELEDAVKLYDEGIGLSKTCMEALNKAELKITELKAGLEEQIPEEENEDE